MAFDPNIPEEQLKNEVASTIFFNYDCDRIIGKIDFAVYPHAPKGTEKETLASHAWAEAKKGKGNLDEALVQLLLTIGRARTFDKHNPPKYLAAFNAEGIVFIEYSAVHQVFYQNDFNWNVAPNDHTTKEFLQLAELVGETLEGNALRFEWHTPSLKHFISLNFNAAQTTALLQIDRNNFISIYSRWLEAVKPSIAVDWNKLRKAGIIDGDFYLADIMSQDNQTITEKLYVLLQDDRYILNRQIDDSGLVSYKNALFNDGQKAHSAFWRKYQRPPESIYWDYILDRRDLLVPQDIRERKGSFFTPRQWVELSQQYLADYLGKDWQDEYYIWDCAAGTGNLLAGLTNPSRVWASTLDPQDVDVMHQRIENGAALFKNHVFQFDFLNDSFDKLPPDLKAIVEDGEKRRKLVIYINPPYAEATTKTTITRTGSNKDGVAATKIGEQYRELLGKGKNEVFAQFFIRIYKEIPSCLLAEFSKLKILQGDNFKQFLQNFRAKLEKIFIVPANTFDNVKGTFPIGFLIWNTAEIGDFVSIVADKYDKHGKAVGGKNIYAIQPGQKRLNAWILQYRNEAGETIGLVPGAPPDVQHSNQITILSKQQKRYCHPILATALIPWCVYLGARFSVAQDWDNDRDQFLWPNDRWLEDSEFQTDCLAYTLLHGQNRISSAEGINHWIPFREQAMGMQNAYRSHFMVEFIEGKLAKPKREDGLMEDECLPQYATGQTPITFSEEAQQLLDAGLALFRYYHKQEGANPNASYYDIRRHFQGVNTQGRMNSKSEDTEYTRLIAAVREARRHLGDTKIAPKVYEYGFLLS